MKPVFGGFETRLKFIKFGQWLILVFYINWKNSIYVILLRVFIKHGNRGFGKPILFFYGISEKFVLTSECFQTFANIKKAFINFKTNKVKFRSKHGALAFTGVCNLMTKIELLKIHLNNYLNLGRTCKRPVCSLNLIHLIHFKT